MASDAITIVSGLPRSGTSVMMQMLHAGGVPVLTDRLRSADEDNPRGYMELEKVKNLKQDKTWLPEAMGKAVKIIHLLIPELPADYAYRIVFMNRDLAEVVRSQSLMLQRSGKPGATLSADRLAEIYSTQLKTVRHWLANQPHCRVLEVNYADLLAEPAAQAQRVASFLERPLDVRAMAAAVDPSLYRNRLTP